MSDSGSEMQDARSGMSYRDLEIWKLAREVAITVHHMTVQNLPKFEMYEEGGQIRRSAKSISANIVEGYGRRRYKQELIRFLVFAHASCDETIDHLEVLFETKSLTNEVVYRDLSTQLDLLGRKLNVFIDSVERSHRVDRRDIPNPESRLAHLASSTFVVTPLCLIRAAIRRRWSIT